MREVHLTKSRRVNFHRFEEDFEVALLGSLGLSTKYICKQTGLTPCQVTYRLMKSKVKRADYRNGTGNEARAILNKLKPQMAPLVRGHIRLVERIGPAPKRLEA